MMPVADVTPLRPRHVKCRRLSRFECDYVVHQMDANHLVGDVGGFDVAYFDPPYNQHPYGSNYFMLNLLVNYEEPTRSASSNHSAGRAG